MLMKKIGGSATALELKVDGQRSRVCDGSVAEKKKGSTPCHDAWAESASRCRYKTSTQLGACWYKEKDIWLIFL